MTSRSCIGTPIVARAVPTQIRSCTWWIVFPQVGQVVDPWMSRRNPSRPSEESRRANRSMSTEAPVEFSNSDRGTRTGVLQTKQRGIRRQVHAMERRS